MSMSRLLHEFRPLLRMLEEPLTRGTPVTYGFPYRPFLADPFSTPPSTVHPAIDLTEGRDGYTVEAELPGLKKENIDITVSDGGRSVTVRGRTFGRPPGDSSEPVIETGASPGGVVASPETPSSRLTAERVYSGTSSFTRTIWLPRPVDTSNITAKLADGILTLKASKLEDKESIKINVD